MKPVRPTSASPWTRMLNRRDILKLGAVLAGGGAVAPLLTACSGPTGSRAAPVGTSAGGSPPPLSGPITLLTEGGDPTTQPTLKKVYDGFAAQNPGIDWDIRAPAGASPEWDRLARALLESGEPVGLILIDGQFVRAWARDGLLADLAADPAMADVLARVPRRFQFPGPGGTIWAFPLAASMGVQTTGLYYNKAILDRAGLEAPRTLADLTAMVKPLAAMGVAPLVHCSGDAVFNPLLVTWLLPMIAEGTGDPLAFAESTIRGDIRYDSPEWIEAFRIIADLRTSGVLLRGSGATDYGTMQQLMLQGKAAMTCNGSWMLTQILAGTPSGAFDLHVAPLPLVPGATKARPILAWGGFALPAQAARSRDSVHAFLEYASRPEVDRAVVAGLQAYSSIAASNDAIQNAVAQEFLPMFEDAITPMDWLWEPEITTEVGNQVQALVKGDTDPAAVGKAIQAVAEELRSSGRSYYP
ncbi:MAG TPA: extracellular solute-binding protein [Candidatus Limnocylindrales bacterium]|nr:extracellular solute-binding protein [Candidatus Limnocylindrales bacterium]